MIILGIDPGTTSVGFALVETGPPPRLIKAGLLSIHATDAGERLQELHRGMRELIDTWHPEAVSVEKLFFSVNVKTAMSVSEARGVILLTARLAGITVYEYTPQKIKKTLTGDGAADKLQVQKMVSMTLPEAKELRARDDVFDAIASALTCCFNEKLHTKKVDQRN